MPYNISAFSHIGTQREINQDRILVFDKILDDGFIHYTNQAFCYCFVADGIGGGIRGEIASQFILEKISDSKDTLMNLDSAVISESAENINKELLGYSSSNPEFYGTGSTLTGLIIAEKGLSLTINAGDSEIRILRNDMLFKITEEQVLDDSTTGSPLMSYFGGKGDYLDISITESLRKIVKNDIYVIASDGLFSSITPREVKNILSQVISLEQKSINLLNKSLANGSDDNVSCILIEVI